MTSIHDGPQANLDRITGDAVLRAVAECNDIGREGFLKRYGFGKSSKYFLVLNDVAYDGKAILGAAFRHVSKNGKPLAHDAFVGGDRTVRKTLEKLGFSVEVREGTIPSADFERGRVYNRRTDIHGKFGGQERGGIATPDRCPYVFLFTGQQGNDFGYSDKFRADGVFEYTGEGQVGDMSFVRGNRAIRDHAEFGKDLLLFEGQIKKGEYRFLGTYVCDGWDVRPAPDKNGAERNAIVFHLVPSENVELEASKAGGETPAELSLDDLRQRAYSSATHVASLAGRAMRSVFARSRDVRDYVLKRANGVCEACKKPAPFLRNDGTSYLEPHHTRRLSDGGPDHPRWVGAVCPTCHRLIHHGLAGHVVNQQLEEYLGEIERQLTSVSQP